MKPLAGFARPLQDSSFSETWVRLMQAAKIALRTSTSALQLATRTVEILERPRGGVQVLWVLRLHISLSDVVPVSGLFDRSSS